MNAALNKLIQSWLGFRVCSESWVYAFLWDVAQSMLYRILTDVAYEIGARVGVIGGSDSLSAEYLCEV